MPTHAMTVQGNSAILAAVRTQIGGNITLPAGGPWNIYGIHSTIVHDNALPAEGLSGILTIDSASGDISPDPAPGEYPLIGPQAMVAATTPAAVVPLNIFPVNWSAPGKAVITLWHTLSSAITNAGAVQAGILFGSAKPEMRPLTFSAGIRGTPTLAAETQSGNITLAEKATRIVGVLGLMSKNSALTAAESVMATFRLDSADAKLTPAVYPFNCAISSQIGDDTSGPTQPQAQYIPVDIPVEGGSVISVFVTLQRAVTANVDAHVFIAYE